MQKEAGETAGDGGRRRLKHGVSNCPAVTRHRTRGECAPMINNPEVENGRPQNLVEEGQQDDDSVERSMLGSDFTRHPLHPRAAYSPIHS